MDHLVRPPHGEFRTVARGHRGRGPVRPRARPVGQAAGAQAQGRPAPPARRAARPQRQDRSRLAAPGDRPLRPLRVGAGWHPGQRQGRAVFLPQMFGPHAPSDRAGRMRGGPIAGRGLGAGRRRRGPLRRGPRADVGRRHRPGNRGMARASCPFGGPAQGGGGRPGGRAAPTGATSGSRSRGRVGGEGRHGGGGEGPDGHRRSVGRAGPYRHGTCTLPGVRARF